MSADQKLNVPVLARYAIAFPIAIFVSLAVLLYYGPEEYKGYEALCGDRAIIFATVFLTGFCFPALSRWYHSAALFGFGIALYFIIHPMDETMVEWDWQPQFRAVVTGGSLAVALHVLIDLVHWAVRRITRSLERMRAEDLARKFERCEPPASLS
jgi:hypothetical protein